MSSPIAKKAPSGRRRDHLHLPPDAPSLAAGLTEAAARMVAYAGDCAAAHERDPKKAVHEFRKSVRRTRALVKLVRPIVGERRYRALNDELREVLGPTSALRDADVLVELVAAQEREEDTRAQLDALEGLLRAEQAAHRRGRTGDVLAASLDRLRPVPARFARALPGDMDRADLRAALEVSFERVKRRFRRCRRALGDHERVHDWRKRVKETRYQLELLGGRRGGPAKELHDRFAALAEELGVITDHIALYGLVADRRQELAGLHPERLLSRVHAAVQGETRAAVAASADLFRRKPRALARRVVPGA